MFNLFLTVKEILRKLGGDKISGKVFTFDGNAEETQELGGVTYAKIANTAPNLHNVTKAVYSTPDGSTIDVPAENMIVEDLNFGSGNVQQRINVSMMGKTLYAIILDASGLWVYAQPGFGYCSYIEFAETIVPIDQKYLPGVCLPVVELETVLTAGTETELPETDAAKLDVVVRTDYPIVVKFTTAEVGAFTMLLGKVVFSDDMFAYSGAFPFGDQTYKLTMLYEGGWVVMLSVV